MTVATARTDVVEAGPAVLAVFDLDGTITRRDTLLPYLVSFARQHPGGLWRLWRLPLSLARFALGLSDHGHLKSSVIRQVMRGATRQQVAEATRLFCHRQLPAMLRPGARQTIREYRSRSSRLVLLSASVDLYVPEIGRSLGFDEVICTGMSWQGERLDGGLLTENRRGSEKRRCLESLRHRYPRARIVAYGNAASDFEHLLTADEAWLVNPGPSLRRRAAAEGIGCLDWESATHSDI